MRFGHFDDARREYVIDTPRTPLPWINYLGSEDFFSLVSNTGGGYSFYRDARLRRLTRYRYNNSPLDMDGHRIYINDGGTIWNPGWQPTKTPLDSYSCRHGLGYTILQGEKNGIAAAQELFVPRGDACEIDRLTLENKTAAPRTLDVFSYVEFCLWDAMDDSSNFQRNFSIGEVELEPNAIYHKTEYRERRDHYAVFWANTPVTSFDTSRDAFCGVYGGPADPQAVRAGHCSGSIAHGWAPVGALHIHVKLAPGECRSILFGLGYIENPQQEKFIAPGVINKTRKTLYLWDGKELKRITPPRFRVMEVCVEGMKIAYAGCMVEPIEKELVGVYCYDAEKSKITCLLPEDEYYIEGMTFWGDSLAYCGTKMDRYSCAQCPDLLLLNLETGARTLLCDTDDEINVGNPVGSDCRMGGGYVMRADGEYLYFLTGVYDATHLWRIDRTGKMEKLLEKDGSIDCFDVQNGAVYCVAMYDMRLQELYRFAEGKLTRLSSWNDDFFLTKPPVIPQPLQFINSDGVQIDGFVMTPIDHVPGKKTPVILDIHGGPHLTYGAVYYHEMQYWANHGYYVIYCNPRGGESRGNEFGYICGRFGTIDYDDIMAFCDEALKAYPDMDEKHMGVTGGSYGGFMTNWIIGHTNRFAAAASQRGIANFVSMEGTSDIGTLFAERQILATTHTNLDKMWKQSPLKYADRCTTPTLFIHSEEDYRCWMVEALQMYSTLIHHGVPTRLCLFHGENHELSRGGKPKGRIRRLQEITAWMDKYLKEE